MGHFYDPTSSFFLRGLFEFSRFLSPTIDMGYVAVLLNDLQSGCTGIASIGAQMLVSSGEWIGRSTTMASRTASNCDTSCRLAPVTTSDNTTPRPSTSKWRLLSFFPPIRRIGTDALLSHWRLYHCTVNTLPSPGNAFKLVVLSETQFAQCLKDPCLLPLQEAGVDCAGTAVALGGQGLSLAACAQYKHDAFKY